MSTKFTCYNGICIKTCEIEIFPPWKGKKDTIKEGTLVQVRPNSTQFCVIQIKGIKNNENFYSILQDNILQISEQLYPFLLAVKNPKARVQIIKNKSFVNFIIKLTVDLSIIISGKILRENGDIKCVIKYIGEVPEYGDGRYIGVMILDSCHLIKKLNMKISRKYFNSSPNGDIILTADQILPLTIDENDDEYNLHLLADSEEKMSFFDPFPFTDTISKIIPSMENHFMNTANSNDYNSLGACGSGTITTQLLNHTENDLMSLREINLSDKMGNDQNQNSNYSNLINIDFPSDFQDIHLSHVQYETSHSQPELYTLNNKKPSNKELQRTPTINSSANDDKDKEYDEIINTLQRKISERINYLAEKHFNIQQENLKLENEELSYETINPGINQSVQTKFIQLLANNLPDQEIIDQTQQNSTSVSSNQCQTEVLFNENSIKIIQLENEISNLKKLLDDKDEKLTVHESHFMKHQQEMKNIFEKFQDEIDSLKSQTQFWTPELIKNVNYLYKQQQIHNHQQKQRLKLRNRIKSQRNRFNNKYRKAANENSSKDILSASEGLTIEDCEFVLNADKNDKIEDTVPIKNLSDTSSTSKNNNKNIKENYTSIDINCLDILPRILPYISAIKDFSKYKFTIEHIHFILNLREGDLIINSKTTSQKEIGIIRFIKPITEYGPGIYFGVENFIGNFSMTLNDEVISILKNNFSCLLAFADILSANDILPVPEHFDSGRYIATFDKRQANAELTALKLKYPSNNNNNVKENYEGEDTQLDIYSIPNDKQSNKYTSKRVSHNKSRNSTYDDNLSKTNIDEDLLIKEFANASMETEEIPNSIMDDDEIFKDMQRKLEIKKQEQYLKSQLNVKNSIDNQSNNYSGKYQNNNNNNYPENLENENTSSHKHRSLIDQSNLSPIEIINQFPPDYVKNNSLLNCIAENSTVIESYTKYLDPTFKDQRDHLHNSKRDDMKNENDNKHSITESNPNTIIVDHPYNTRSKNLYTGTLPKSTTHTNSHWYVNSPREDKLETTELPMINEINDSHQEEPQISLIDGYSEELGGFIITCKKSDCNGAGFLDAEDESQFFICPNCKSYNCLQCRVIHTGFTCQEYKNKSKENIKSFTWECNFCSEKVSSQSGTCLHCNEGKKNAASHSNKSAPASKKQTNKKNNTKNKNQFNSEKQIITENKSPANDKNLYARNESITRKDEWLCKKCGFNNTINDVFCGTCKDRKDKQYGDQIDIKYDDNNTLNDNQKDDISEKNIKWECKYCTFQNNEDTIVCITCGKTDEVLHKIKLDKEFTLVQNRKQKNEKKQENTKNVNNGEWICMYCSFKNNREFKTCGCKYKNDPAKKYMFHCLKPKCIGWWPHEGNAVKMKCPICNIKNCLSCRAIHSGMKCKDYQQSLLNRYNGEVKCPNCQVNMHYKDEKLVCIHCENQNSLITYVKNSVKNSEI